MSFTDVLILAVIIGVLVYIGGQHGEIERLRAERKGLLVDREIMMQHFSVSEEGLLELIVKHEPELQTIVAKDGVLETTYHPHD